MIKDRIHFWEMSKVEFEHISFGGDDPIEQRALDNLYDHILLEEEEIFVREVSEIATELQHRDFLSGERQIKFKPVRQFEHKATVIAAIRRGLPVPLHVRVEHQL
jgi:hypothetical protein